MPGFPPQEAQRSTFFILGSTLAHPPSLNGGRFVKLSPLSPWLQLLMPNII